MISVQLQTYTGTAHVLEERYQESITLEFSTENGMVHHLHYRVLLQIVP